MRALVASTALTLLATLLVAVPVSAETANSVLKAPASKRVYDFAKVLSSAEEVSLRERLQKMSKKGTAAGAIVLVRRVEGESIESFAKRLGNGRRLGNTTTKRGFVIVAAIDQRRWRLDTNRVLRAKLTDDAAKQLMQENVVPAFRQKQYAKGLGRALAAIEVAATRTRVVETAPAAGGFTPAGVVAPVSSIEPMGVIAVAYLAFLGLLGLGAIIALLSALCNQRGGSHSVGWGQSHFGGGFMSHDNSSSSSSSFSDNSSSAASSSDSGGGGSCDGGGGASGGW